MRLPRSTFVLLLSLIISQEVSGTSPVPIPAGYSVSIKYDQTTEEAVFDLELVDGTWLGLALGASTMAKGTDMIMCKAKAGVGECRDMISVG